MTCCCSKYVNQLLRNLFGVKLLLCSAGDVTSSDEVKQQIHSSQRHVLTTTKHSTVNRFQTQSSTFQRAAHSRTRPLLSAPIIATSGREPEAEMTQCGVPIGHRYTWRAWETWTRDKHHFRYLYIRPLRWRPRTSGLQQ